MKTYSVVFTPEAEEQLAELYRHIAENASADIRSVACGQVVSGAGSIRL